MSKLHKKTGTVCMICDESSDKFIHFHKTRRQTHLLCLECGIQYLRPILRILCNNIRKNIRQNVDRIKCPGAYHSAPRNMCKKRVLLSDIKVPECEISLDIFRINYTLSSPNNYMCPEEKCGQVFEVDEEFPGNNLQCHIGCKSSWCRQCLARPYHEGKSCSEYEAEQKNTQHGKFMWEMKAKGLIKFCPLCRVATYRNGGCNKMTCSQCGIKWCWLCKEKNINYDHFNSEGAGGQIGKCSGKLWQGVDEDGNIIHVE